MVRARKAPRRLILGILLLSVALLTALSLPGLGLEDNMGPFARVWVSLWARAFGIPALWCLVALGLLWGLALLARWRRRPLLAATLILPPLLVLGDALATLAFPLPARPWIHGELAAGLLGAAYRFFGAGATAQVAVALTALTLAALVLGLRYALPAPIGARVAAGLAAAGEVLLALGGWIGRGLAAVGAALGGALRRALATGAGRLREGWRLRREARARGWQEEPETEPAAPLEAAAAPAAPRIAAEERSPEEGLFPEVEPPAPAKRPARPARRRATESADALEDLPEAADGPAIAPLELLEEREEAGSGVGREEIDRQAALITETLASFGIEGAVGEVHPGPVITRYEFTPGVGVTISQISSRQDDLALALRAPRVRLLAPIPGKAAVGIELPNRVPAVISFRDIAKRPQFQEAREPLPICLGKDVSGRPFYTSLERMPHLLVAGTTGSGKSVCINSMIVSLLLRCPPEHLRLLLIDPKMLELTTYNEIPHLLRPVVTEAREAARALHWLTREMERRYRLLAGLGARNIAAYLERRAEACDDPPLEAMPYIVVFVDELADLMLSNPSEIEVPIARLAQMARAVGIHLVLATQRPSVDVITGVIKANFPARIAFQVATRTDSRTILDMNGAESLVGRGDMLFIPPGKAQAHRVHGAFLSDTETERVAGYLRQYPPAEPIGKSAVEETDRGIGDDLDDPLYNEALRIVVSTRQGSTSLLQRRLRVGYTRAGRLMDLLERAGIVGPPDGSRAREVLVPVDFLEQQRKASALQES
jgi:S-DNA-T family DNA segregation ATPase FtsK/SpoIIIE